MKGRIGIGESGFDSYHPKYVNCKLCTLAVIIYTINKIHLFAKQHLSLILDLSGGIWPLDLRNLKFHPACRTCFSGPGRSNLISALYLPPLAWISPSISSSLTWTQQPWAFSQHNWSQMRYYAGFCGDPPCTEASHQEQLHFNLLWVHIQSSVRGEASLCRIRLNRSYI